MKAIAQKNGVLCDEEYFDTTIARCPSVKGRGFPDLSLAESYAPSALSMPVDVERKIIRKAAMEDLPTSKPLFASMAYLPMYCLVVAILNDAILHTDVSSDISLMTSRLIPAIQAVSYTVPLEVSERRTWLAQLLRSGLPVSA